MSLLPNKENNREWGIVLVATVGTMTILWFVIHYMGILKWRSGSITLDTIIFFGVAWIATITMYCLLVPSTYLVDQMEYLWSKYGWFIFIPTTAFLLISFISYDSITRWHTGWMG